MKKSKRGDYTRKRRKKYLHLKHMGLYNPVKENLSTDKEIEEFEEDIPKTKEKAEVLEIKQKIMKSFLISKTFWFNILALAVMVAGNFGFKEFATETWVNDAGVGLILIVNLILRFITKEPIVLKSPK